MEEDTYFDELEFLEPDDPGGESVFYNSLEEYLESDFVQEEEDNANSSG